MLASAGTVVTYPEGQSPPVDMSQFPTGEIVIIDANGVKLARLYFTSGNDFYAYLNPAGEASFFAVLTNETQGQTVKISGGNTLAKFNTTDCTGQAFTTTVDNWLLNGPLLNQFFAMSSQTEKYSQILRSEFDGKDDICRPITEATSNARTVFPYIPASEILNAVYPLDLEQLP